MDNSSSRTDCLEITLSMSGKEFKERGGIEWFVSEALGPSVILSTSGLEILSTEEVDDEIDEVKIRIHSRPPDVPTGAIPEVNVAEILGAENSTAELD